MKKSVLLGFCSLLTFSSLVGCSKDDKPAEVVVSDDATVTISNSDGGTIEFVRPDDYKYKLGDLCPLDVTPNEGYRILYVTVNNKKIRPDQGDYMFEVAEKNVVISAVFEKIGLDMRDFEFSLDKVHKTAKITKYVAMSGLVPTPFIIPETYTDPSDGTVYKITGIGVRDEIYNGETVYHQALENSQISKIHLSKNIETLEQGALNAIPTLREITVDDANPNFKAVDGDLYNKDLTELVSVPYHRRGTYTVKDSVTKIAPYAFRNNGFIDELIIGEKVTTLGESAFQKMRDLTSVKLSNNITEIPDYAFDYCSELSEVNIPTSATRIGVRAFNFCNNIFDVKIPASVKTIDKEAFFHVKYLSNLTFEEGVETIGEFSFGQCDEFETLKLPKSLKIIGDYAFDECKSLREVTFQEGLEEIGNCAFQLCLGFENVNLPASLTTLGHNPFLGCAPAKFSVHQDNLNFTVVDGIIFTKDMTELVAFPYTYLKGAEDKENGFKYVVPDTVSVIRNRAFAFNIELEKITIPRTVVEMTNAFYNLLPKGNMPGNYQLELHYEGTQAEFVKKFYNSKVKFNNKAFFKNDLVHCSDGTLELIGFVDESEEPNKQEEGI